MYPYRVLQSFVQVCLPGFVCWQWAYRGGSFKMTMRVMYSSVIPWIPFTECRGPPLHIFSHLRVSPALSNQTTVLGWEGSGRVPPPSKKLSLFMVATQSLPSGSVGASSEFKSGVTIWIFLRVDNVPVCMYVQYLYGNSWSILRIVCRYMDYLLHVLFYYLLCFDFLFWTKNNNETMMILESWTARMTADIIVKSL